MQWLEVMNEQATSSDFEILVRCLGLESWIDGFLRGRDLHPEFGIGVSFVCVCVRVCELVNASLLS